MSDYSSCSIKVNIHIYRTRITSIVDRAYWLLNQDVQVYLSGAGGTA
jgi:hypothetical protein